MPGNWSVEVDDRRALLTLNVMSDPKTSAGALLIGANVLKAHASPYPPVTHHPPQSFKTEKQRRYVMMALRKGLIEIPYKRGGLNSQDLGQRWRTSQRENGAVVVLSNNASYAGVVVGPKKRQSLYMGRLGWKTQEQVIKKAKPEMQKQAVAYLSKQIKGVR